MNIKQWGNYVLLGILPGAAIFAGDNEIKKKVENHTIDIPDAGPQIEATRAFIILRRLHNKGAARGLLQGRPGLVKAISFVLTAMVAGKLVWEAKKMPMHMKLMTVLSYAGLSLACGGGASNTLDRIKRGYVVDYFSINRGPEAFRDLVFNISDMAIAFGLIMASIGTTDNKENIIGETNE